MPDFGSPCEVELREGSISSETRPVMFRASMSQAFGLGLETCIEELCGSGEWQKT